MKSRSSTSARLPDFGEPMKAKLVDSMPSGDWIYEIKFDGYRALALRGGSEARVLSRNEKDLGGKFPEVKDSIAALNIQEAIIDGEIVALDKKGRSSFQLLQGLDMGQKKPPIVFYAFDLLQLNGKNLQNLPIEERKAKLKELLKKPPGVIRYSVSFTKDIPELLDRTRKLGLEGLIGKRSGSRYEPGKRTGAWIKLKLHQEQEFVIGGYTEPEGSRKYFGALLVGFYEGKKPATGHNVIEIFQFSRHRRHRLPQFRPGTNVKIPLGLVQPTVLLRAGGVSVQRTWTKQMFTFGNNLI
jgi:bifunctional non-homologous end joining protein LigD